MSKAKALLQRIQDEETVIVAEGYIFAFERLGYLKAGRDHPELVRQMYRDFVRAGSDVVQAFTVKYDSEGRPCTLDGVEMNEALRRLVEAGGDVVGFNCTRGPETIMKQLESANRAGIKAPLAVLQVVYRTMDEHPSFSSIPDPNTGKRAFPDNLNCLLCSRSDITDFGERCAQLKISYVGLCCGNATHYTRVLAESYERRPEASKYSPDMTLNGWLGTRKGEINEHYSAMADTFQND